MKLMKTGKRSIVIMLAVCALSIAPGGSAFAHGSHHQSHHQSSGKKIYCVYHHKYHNKKTNCKKYCTLHKKTHSNGKKHCIKHH